jgi:hypothetical protein
MRGVNMSTLAAEIALEHGIGVPILDLSDIGTIRRQPFDPWIRIT